jgi:hypothetical protein
MGIGYLAAPTKQQILFMTNSLAFPAWQGSATLSMPGSRTKYAVASPAGTNSIYNYTGVGSAAARQSICGTMGFTWSGTPLAESTYVVLGDMFLHIDLEFEDMSGLMTTAPTFPPTPLESKVGHEKRKKDELELKREVHEVSKPKSTSNKSTNRGKTNSTLFDSTRGYPGEGPNVHANSLHNWIVEFDVIRDSKDGLTKEKRKEISDILADITGYVGFHMADKDYNFIMTTLALPDDKWKKYEEDFSEFLQSVYDSLEENIFDVVHWHERNECVCTTLIDRTPKLAAVFDSTLGFPGEGPFTVDANKFHSWCAAVLRTNLTYYRARKDLHLQLLQLVASGGDHKIATTDFSSIVNYLSIKPSDFTPTTLLALTSIITNLYDRLDDESGDRTDDVKGKEITKEKSSSD